MNPLGLCFFVFSAPRKHPHIIPSGPVLAGPMPRLALPARTVNARSRPDFAECFEGVSPVHWKKQKYGPDGFIQRIISARSEAAASAVLLLSRKTEVFPLRQDS